MKSIAVIVPYFGQIPDYFEAWKRTVLYNETIDFLLFTDDPRVKSEGNLKVILIAFSDFREKFQQKFSFPIALGKPYKLCDYKPSYGYVLEEYIQGYDFWGHCDMDLLFGDIRKFITEDILNQYEKVLEHGHFTLYHNDPETNIVFMSCAGYGDYDYKKAFTSNDSLYFDEHLGTQLIFRKNRMSTYCNPKIFYDVKTSEKEFANVFDNIKNVIFQYKEGRLYSVIKAGNGFFRKEIMYAHFQKRAMDYSLLGKNSSFYIIPNCLIPANQEISDKLFRCRGEMLYALSMKKKHVTQYLKRYREGEYSSFYQYYKERKSFRMDMINAKQEVRKYMENEGFE